LHTQNTIFGEPKTAFFELTNLRIKNDMTTFFLSYIFIYSYLILKSIYLFFKIKPDVIVSTGTHTAVQICYIAKLFKKKVVYIETYANITRRTLTGKIVYPISDLFIIHWEEMKKFYPKAVLI
jgi:UDP-N-acetylglucosamine:LPS N-acetylglucosamine transferase